MYQYTSSFYSLLNYCRFRKTKAKRIDFRYSYICDCTLGEFYIELGDFSFCNFKGYTNFIDNQFENCSFTCATFEHNCIRMNNTPKGIIQENSKLYHKELICSKDWIKLNPCSSFSSMNHEANTAMTDKIKKMKSNVNIADEAMSISKQLSGIYSGKGLIRNSNKAYHMSKICENIF